jgi:hypothetical protein
MPAYIPYFGIKMLNEVLDQSTLENSLFLFFGAFELKPEP